MKKKILLFVVPVLLIGLAITITRFLQSHKSRPFKLPPPCIDNLRWIDTAKQRWAIDNNKTKDDIPKWDDLRRYAGPDYTGPFPLQCPSGGIYTIGKVGDAPTCSIGGYHSLL